MGSLGPFEILLLFLVILLVFGAKRIPEIARGLGKGIKEFKQATNDIQRELTIEDQKSIQRPRPPAQGTPAPRETQQAAPQQQQSASSSSDASSSGS